MKSIVKADKNRLTIRGVENGVHYLVQRLSGGWWVEVAADKVRRVRTVTKAKNDLSEHLQAMAEAGFSFEPSDKQPVPPCRF